MAPGIGVGDALLQSRQLGAHRGLIAQARRHLAHQAGHFHAGLDETENIIDEQQHVAVFVVPEILGHRQRRVTHAETAARRLVHLPEHHHHVRQYAGLLHVTVKLLALATTFADAAENAYALLVLDHVVDHFGEQHRLAHAGPAEQTRFAAALQRHQHIDDLDARLKDLGLGGTPRQRRRGSMDGAPLDICRRRLAVDGVAEHVEHARENSLADRRLQRPARVLHRHAAERDPGWGSARFHARDARRVGPVPRWRFLSVLRVQQRIDGRQMRVEPYIYDTAAHRDHRAGSRIDFLLHDCPTPAPVSNKGPDYAEYSRERASRVDASCA